MAVGWLMPEGGREERPPSIFDRARETWGAPERINRQTR